MKFIILFFSLTFLIYLPVYGKTTNHTQNKFDINTVTSKSIYKLCRLMGWPEQQGVILMNYRKRIGGFENIRQINYIRGLKKKVKTILIKYFYSKTPSFSIKDILNRIGNWNNENNELGNFLDHIHFFINNPVNINTASLFDLLKIPFLSQSAASAIIRDRKINGPFTKAWQILKIRSIIPELYYCIRPLITVNKKEGKKTSPAVHGFKGSISSRYYTKHSSDIDTETSPYLFTKIMLEINKSIRFNGCLAKSILEKGSIPGSWFGSEGFKVFDSAVYNLQIRNIDFIRLLVVGNFSLNFGEGLIFDSGFGSSGLKLTGSKHEREGIRPKAGTTKNNLFEGIAVSYTNGAACITSFFSRNSFDASTDNGIITGKLRSIISSDPVHTESCNDKNRDSLRETALGLDISGILLENFKVSLRLVNYSYQKEILPPLKRDSYYSFRGQKLFQSGFDFHIVLKSMSIFGEAALCSYKRKAYYSSDNQSIVLGKAGIFGINFGFKSISLTLSYHCIEPEFISPHGISSDNYKPGRRGLTIGFNKFFKGTFYIKAGVEILSEIWRSYYHELPRLEKNYKAEFIFKPFNFISFKASIKKKIDFINYFEKENISLPANNIKKKFGCIIKFFKKNDLILNYAHTKEKFTETSIKNEILSLRINIRHNSLRLSFGGHLFNVENSSLPVYAYDTRLYLWHEGILSYYRSGTSFFFLAESSGNLIKFGLKYGRIKLNTLPVEHRIRVQMILGY